MASKAELGPEFEECVEPKQAAEVGAPAPRLDEASFCRALAFASWKCDSSDGVLESMAARIAGALARAGTTPSLLFHQLRSQSACGSPNDTDGSIGREELNGLVLKFEPWLSEADVDIFVDWLWVHGRAPPLPVAEPLAPSDADVHSALVEEEVAAPSAPRPLWSTPEHPPPPWDVARRIAANHKLRGRRVAVPRQPFQRPSKQQQRMRLQRPAARCCAARPSQGLEESDAGEDPAAEQTDAAEQASSRKSEGRGRERQWTSSGSRGARDVISPQRLIDTCSAVATTPEIVASMPRASTATAAAATGLAKHPVASAGSTTAAAIDTRVEDNNDKVADSRVDPKEASIVQGTSKATHAQQQAGSIREPIMAPQSVTEMVPDHDAACAGNQQLPSTVPRAVHVKVVMFNFDQTISVVHVFRALAGWDCGVSEPFALTERGQIRRIRELDGAVPFSGAGGFAKFALGGEARIKQLKDCLVLLRSRRIRIVICTEGLIGAAKKCLKDVGLLAYVNEVYGFTDNHHGETAYDKHVRATIPSHEDCLLCGSKDRHIVDGKANLVRAYMKQARLLDREVLFVEDDPRQIECLQGVCLTLLVNERAGITTCQLEKLAKMTVSAHDSSLGLESAPTPSGQVDLQAVRADVSSVGSPIKLLVLAFDQVLSVTHVFKALAGWELGIPPSFAVSERGQIRRIAELDVTHYGGQGGFARFACGGDARIGKLTQLFKRLKGKGAKLIVCTKGFVGTAKKCLSDVGMLAFFEEVYGNIGHLGQLTSYDHHVAAMPLSDEDELFCGRAEALTWDTTQTLILQRMGVLSLSADEVALVHDEPEELSKVSGTCRTVSVKGRAGLQKEHMDLLRDIANCSASDDASVSGDEGARQGQEDDSFPDYSSSAQTPESSCSSRHHKGKRGSAKDQGCSEYEDDEFDSDSDG